MAEVKRNSSHAAARVVYAPSTMGALAYAAEPAYRSTRLAEALPQHREFPAAVPAPRPPQTVTVPQPKPKQDVRRHTVKAEYVGTKIFLLLCVGLIACMGIMLLFNCKAVSDTQREINRTTEEIKEMNLKIGEINMDYNCSLDRTTAEFATQRMNIMARIAPGD